MKKYAHIDYTQRPESYWDDEASLQAILRDVKGTQRRRMIRDYWRQGRLAELSDELLKGTLAEDVRDRLGKIHPAFMGGEYLPDCEGDEVEIARLELQSTTGDVISIRARRDPAGIRYRIADEYGTEFDLAFETSRRPLPLRQLIQFLERSGHPDSLSGLATCYSEMNAQGSSRAAMRHFTRLSSEFYPQLEEHFERAFEDWVREEEVEQARKEKQRRSADNRG